MILLGTAIDKAGEKVCEKAGPESESAGDELVTGLQDAVGALIMKVKHSLHPAPLPIPPHSTPPPHPFPTATHPTLGHQRTTGTRATHHPHSHPHAACTAAPTAT